MSYAALWQADQKIMLGARYYTNLGMTNTNETESTGTDYLWAGNINRSTATNSLSAYLELTSRNRSAEDGLYDSDDQYANVGYLKNWKKTGVDIDLEFIRDSTMATEILLSTLIPFNTNKRREKLAFNAQAYIDVSSKDKWLFDYFFGETQFRDSGFLLYPLNDFYQSLYRVNWQRTITENFTSQIAAYQFYTEVEKFNNESITNGVEFGFIYSFSDVSSLNALVGARFTSNEIGTQNINLKTENEGSIYQVDYTYQRETYDIKIALSQRMEPDYTTGRLLQKTRATMSYQQQWHDNWIFKISSSLIQEEPDSTILNNRLLSSASKISALARITEYMNISFSYQYLERDYIDLNDGKADGNIYLLSLIYRDKPRMISR